MASTFLTRLRLGAQAGRRATACRGSTATASPAAALLLLVIAALVAIVAALAISDAGRTYLRLAAPRLDHSSINWIQDTVLVISFRYHLVSIVAVFLALALGIVVGTTALNGPITKDLRNQVERRQEAARRRSPTR